MNLVVLVIAFLSNCSAQVKQDNGKTVIPSDVCVIGYNYTKFNYRTHYCCKGFQSIIKPKDRGIKPCCDEILPNGTKVTCCNERQLSVVLLKTASCCDIQLYNTETDFCRNNKIYKRLPTATASSRTTEIPTRDTPTLSSNIFFITVICCVVFSCVSVTTVFVCIYSGNCKYRPKYTSVPSRASDKMTENQPNISKRRNLSTENLETDGYEEIEETILHQSQEADTVSRDCRAQDISDNNNVLSNVTSNKLIQTEGFKLINVRNVMGKPFDERHEFNKNNKSLQLPNSAAMITLSEEDVSGGAVECYASTHRNLAEIYQTFTKYLKTDEEVVSPTLEYFFPNKKRLLSFASVEMDYYNCGCRDSFHAWKFECDSGTGSIIDRVDIPKKDNIEVKNADAFYEIVSPGKVRIYLKSFCTLICTVCHGQHESLSLAAHAYVVTLPSNIAEKHVRVTLYILAGVSQLPDYRYEFSKFINADEIQVHVPPRKINLPRRVMLEDHLAIRLRICSDSEGFWQQRVFDSDMGDYVRVQLLNIVSCPRHASERWPYFKEWHFDTIPGQYCESNKLVFEGAFSIFIENPHPGVSTNIPPPTQFVVTHTVDVSDTKKNWMAQSARQRPSVRPALQQQTSPSSESNGHFHHFPSPNIGAQGIATEQHGPTAVPSRGRIGGSDGGMNQSSENIAVQGRNEQHQMPNLGNYGARPKERKPYIRSDMANHDHDREDRDREIYRGMISQSNTHEVGQRMHSVSADVRAELPRELSD